MYNLNCPEYLRIIDKHLEKEEERADYLLQRETKDKLLKSVQKEIIDKPA